MPGLLYSADFFFLLTMSPPLPKRVAGVYREDDHVDGVPSGVVPVKPLCFHLGLSGVLRAATESLYRNRKTSSADSLGVEPSVQRARTFPCRCRGDEVLWSNSILTSKRAKFFIDILRSVVTDEPFRNAVTGGNFAALRNNGSCTQTGQHSNFRKSGNVINYH